MAFREMTVAPLCIVLLHFQWVFVCHTQGVEAEFVFALLNSYLLTFDQL